MKNCRSIFACPLAGFLLVLCLLSGRTARCQDFAAAGRHFAAAQDAFAQGHFSQAAQEYQATFDITQDPGLLFNIAESWQRAGENRKAVAGYKAYLLAQPGASDRPEVEKRLRELEATVGTTPPEKTETPAGVAPAPAARKPAAPATNEGGLSALPPQTSAGPYRTAAWITNAGAVAKVTAGAVLGLAAQSRADEIHRRATLIQGGQIPPVYDASQADAYESLLSDGRTYNSAAIACFSVAGAVAVASTVLFILDQRHRRESKTQAAKLSLRPHPGLLSAGWSF